MFTHVMIGSNDLERARAFYDATFAALVSVQDHLESLESFVIPCQRARFAGVADVDRREPRPI